jgi:hypothetical protein
MRIRLAAALCVPILLTGCGFIPTSAPSGGSGAALVGTVHGGRQPIIGAHVYLLAANTTGYGSASVSLLNPTFTGLSDSIGAYVLTNGSGIFSISGDYACSSGQQVYLYSLGGDAGAGANSAAGLMAALGACPVAGNFLSSTPFITINEVTTVAAAYALGGYTFDSTHISGSGSALQLTGVANAFLNAANLVNIATGQALTKVPYGNATVPTAELNTLANILSSCVNSSGPSSAGCTALFAAAPFYGDPTRGHVPADTATAINNIVHNPASNIAALFALATAIAPFQPALTKVPLDFTVSLTYTGGGMSNPTAVAVDAKGNIWTTNTSCACLAELASNGVPISPPGGFTGGGLNVPQFLAIDNSGNVWVTNSGSNGISKFSPAGVPLSPATTGFTGGGLDTPVGLAIDANNNVWIPNYSNSSLTELDNSGNPLTPSSGITGNGLALPVAISIDAKGNIWVANYAFPSLSEFTSTGVPAARPAPVGAMESAYGPSVRARPEMSVSLPGKTNMSAILAVYVTVSQTIAIIGANLGAEDGMGGTLPNTGAVFAVAPNGTYYSPYAGNSCGGQDYPYDAHMDADGNIYTPNSGNGSISTCNFDLFGIIPPPPVTTTGYNGTASYFSYGIAADLSGSVVVPNYIGNQFTPANSVTSFIGFAAPTNPFLNVDGSFRGIW